MSSSSSSSSLSSSASICSSPCVCGASVSVSGSACVLESRAGGKVLLSGEHAVVHGATAIAAAIQQHTKVTLFWTENSASNSKQETHSHCNSANDSAAAAAAAAGTHGERDNDAGTSTGTGGTVTNVSEGGGASADAKTSVIADFDDDVTLEVLAHSIGKEQHELNDSSASDTSSTAHASAAAGAGAGADTGTGTGTFTGSDVKVCSRCSLCSSPSSAAVIYRRWSRRALLSSISASFAARLHVSDEHYSLCAPDRVALDEWKTSHNWQNDSNSHAGVAVFLMFFVCIFGARRGVRCRVSSSLPLSAGLGSSASFAAALAAAFTTLKAVFVQQRAALIPAVTAESQPTSSLALAQQFLAHSAGTSCGVNNLSVALSPDCLHLLNLWSFEGERVIHGNPSGVDNACAVYGGMIRYRKEQNPSANTTTVVQHANTDSHSTPPAAAAPSFTSSSSTLSFFAADSLPKLELVITNTGVPRNTKALVAAVAQLKSRFLGVEHIIHAMDAISLQWCDVLQQLSKAQHSKNDSEIAECASVMRKLVDLNAHLLEALDVGHAAIREVSSVARDFGLMSKLTGAGGGGCVMSLVDPTVHDDQVVAFMSAMRARGLECIRTSIGANAPSVAVRQFSRQPAVDVFVRHAISHQ